MTPFGTPVEPEVNSSFATVSGPRAAYAFCDRGAGLGGEQLVETQRAGRVRRERRAPARPASASSAAGELAAVVGEHEPRLGQLGDRPDPAWSALISE